MTWEVGQSLGRYTLECRVGVGGMSEVLLARSHESSGAPLHVALKRLLPQFAEDVGCVARFIDEANLASELRHPNIVQVFEVGELEGSRYYAMEYVDGPSLRDLIEATRDRGEALPVAACVEIARRVCEGLAYAHALKDEQGRPLDIVHRDVSPHNIMVTRRGEVKLLDFGIAKSASHHHRTRTLTLRGTLPYMSPEQIEQSVILDARSDVFSLGAVLYELLSSRRAFAGRTELELLSAVMHGAPSDLRSLRPELPERLYHLVERALEKDRAMRHGSALELGAELAAVAATLPSEDARPAELRALLSSLAAAHRRPRAQAPSRMELPAERRKRPRLQLGRRRWVWTLWAAFAVLVTVTLAGSWGAANVERAQPSVRAPAPAPTPAPPTAPAPAPATAPPTATAPAAVATAVRPRRTVRAKGTLPIFVKPFGEVFIDGESRGLSPLDEPVSLDEGMHTVRVVHPKTGREITRRVRVAAGANKALHIDLR